MNISRKKVIQGALIAGAAMLISAHSVLATAATPERGATINHQNGISPAAEG